MRHDDIVAEIDPRLSPLPLWQYISDTDIQYNLSIVLLVSIEENFVDKNEQCSLITPTCRVATNKEFPNEPDVGYRNFFIPRVEKTSKNEPAGGELFLPKGLF